MESLKLDDFTKYKFLSGIRFSPSGKNTGFVLHQIDIDENKYLSNIYIYNEETKKEIKLTSLDEERSFIWKDEDTILFPAKRDTKDKEKTKDQDLTVYYEIKINGGEANKAFEIPLNISQIKILDEDNLLLTAEYDNNKINLEGLSHDEKEKAKKKIKENKDYEILDEIPFWSNGVGFTNKKRNRLYLYNLKTKKATPITDAFTDITHFKLNKDKSMAIIIANSFTDKMQIKSDLHLYNIAENNIVRLTHIDVFDYSYADFLDDKIIFTGHDTKTFGINENSHFYLMDLSGDNVRKISTDEFDYSMWNSVGSDCRYGSSRSFIVDEDYLYFVTTENDSSYINRVDIAGNIDKVTEKKGSIDGFDMKNGKLQFIGLKNNGLQELYSLDGKVETQLTRFNEWVMENKKISIPEIISFTNDDNIEIHGFIMKPVDFEEGKKYPAILNIHGGPKTVYGNVFYHEMQYWANHGYVVFFCNPRGSDGRGNEFSDIRGKYGTIDYDDIMKFTDLVLEKYDFIDKENIGVTGGSYGGFMTNWIIGHTNRFKAAASQRSISNWTSFFGTTDIGYYFADDQNAATPWSDYEKLWFHSPMKYADKVVTPTLFIHSEEDYRCWLPEGLQMYSALKYHGVESRLCMFRGENHELSRSGKPKHRIKRLEEITNWFDKYLK